MTTAIDKIEADASILGSEAGAGEIARLFDDAKTQAQAAAKANPEYVELSEKVLTALSNFTLPMPQTYQDVTIWCEARGL